MELLTAALILGGMGLLFGVLLTLTSKVFAVPSNPKKDAVRELLPGANCGGCGYPGCDGCAEAIAEGKAPVNACPVGGNEVAAKIAEALGQEVNLTAVKMVAQVVCQGDVEHCKTKFVYSGIQDCVAASLVSNGNRSCQYACLGLGTCVKNCPFDAICIDENKKIAVVDADKCQSCGKCVEVCPKHVMQLAPVNRKVRVMCRAAEKGILVSDNCRVGCIGCERCFNACKFGAITMNGHLPTIDYDKCRSCMMCAEVCPTGAIWASWDERKIASINKDDCIGCGLCKRQCEFEAIIGEIRKPHEIIDACTGCGKCAEKCPKKAITLKVREHTRDAFAKIGTTPVVVEVAAPVTEEKPKPKYSPEVQAKIDAALKAKAEREAAKANTETGVQPEKGNTESESAEKEEQ